IMMDGNLAESIVSQLPGSKYASSLELRDEIYVDTYTIPCDIDTNMGPLEFEIEGKRFLMPIEDLIFNQLEDDPETCVLGITAEFMHEPTSYRYCS
ncbi:3243_t:CDS:2, partial [Acaulospora colombiana]